MKKFVFITFALICATTNAISQTPIEDFFSRNFKYNTYNLAVFNFYSNQYGINLYNIQTGGFKFNFWDNPNYGIGFNLFTWQLIPDYIINIENWGDLNYYSFKHNDIYWSNTLDTTDNYTGMRQKNIEVYSIISPILYVNIVDFPYEPKKHFNAFYFSLSAFIKGSILDYYRFDLPFPVYKKNAELINSLENNEDNIISAFENNGFWFFAKNFELGLSLSSSLFNFEIAYLIGRNNIKGKTLYQNTDQNIGKIEDIGIGGKKIFFPGNNNNILMFRLGLKIGWYN